MALSKNLNKGLNIKDVKRIDYFDNRYYKVLYEIKENQKKRLVEEYFPSVTEILGAYPKPFLARWRGDVGNERADQIILEALNLGSTIHAGAETIAKGGCVVYNPYFQRDPLYTEKEIKQIEKKYKHVFICRFQKEFLQLWRISQLFEELKPINIQTEQTVYSIDHKYAGTLDLLFYIKEGEYNISGSTPLYLEEGYYIGDYKTGKSIDNTNKMQISAYLHAVLEGLPEIKRELKGGILFHTNNERIEHGIKGLKATLINMTEYEMYFNNFLKVYDVYKIDKPVPVPEEFTMPTLLTYSYNDKLIRKTKK